ncbi:unnamed protein product [Effrenium voratum]|uniref:Uncharacterized protein n=1 Tax=Effrenium voratum TaxID=2562239 RepID=A0AA36IU79_9DINO|nr:unnamed protein product [Effrenium voratum]
MAPTLSLLLLGTAAAMKCPGSKSWIHASTKVQAVADASCDDVMSEMIARVTSDWKDPHNGGTYSVLSKADGELNLQRVTGNKKFTDKMTLTFSQEGSQCAVNACSESQSFSIGDFSTNYCNLRNLYCGSADGCVTVKHDFTTEEQRIMPSFGAGGDKKACIVKESGTTPLTLGTAAMKCPGSKSWIHASAEVEAVADASCDDVMSEMIARVTSDWKDPHNGGTYSVLSKADGELNLQRVTGNKKFTDKMTFTFSQEGSQCAVNACSESQSFSIGDFSTNYCNLRNLYCGSADGCVTVKHDFTTKESKVDPSFGAGGDKKACIVKAASVANVLEKTMLRQPELLGGTTEDTLGCVSDNCPVDNQTLQPSPLCVLGNCTKNLAKCLFSSTCRHGVMCELGCFDDLKNTEDDAGRLAGVLECMRAHCPGFPPSKTCAALHCTVEAGACALHSKCRSALECADGCVPGKYAAALAAFTQPVV